MGQYDDIIQHPHYQDALHKPMSIMGRAAQFSAFAALTGYDEAIDETARLTDRRRELTEDEQAALNGAMRQIEELAQRKPPLSVTYFQRDERKEGGRLVTRRGNFRFLDTNLGRLCMTDGYAIPLADLVSVRLLPPDGTAQTPPGDLTF